jgi:DNA mismatch endonuclease (patch repair protein)
MTDVYSPEKRSDVMRQVKGRDTSPELAVRRMLWQLGARYRLHRKDLPGHPDIVMPGRRLAVFVHGCFWHGHDCAEAKVGRNRARDAASLEKLEALGWRALTVWECELKDRPGLEARLRTWLSTV